MKSLPFDSAAVRALAGILTETGLTEIEIEGKDGRIRVARAPATVAARSRRGAGAARGGRGAGRRPPSPTTPTIPARCSARWSASST